MTGADTHLEAFLNSNFLVWFGGGDYLPQETIGSYIGAAIVYGSSDGRSDQAVYDFESIVGHRPDWNKLSAAEEQALLAQLDLEKVFNCDAPVAILPYCNSEGLITRLSSDKPLILANDSGTVEELYSREKSRLIFNQAGLRTSLAETLGRSVVDPYKYYSAQFGTSKLVLAPEYSDGGAWIFPAGNPEEFSAAVRECSKQSSDTTIEVAPYIDGIPLNITCCISPDTETGKNEIIVYPASVQMIGTKELTTSQFRYCGCDFLAVDLAEGLRQNVVDAVVAIANILYSQYGWKGLFGIDLIVSNNHEIVFLEINPRMQSSTYALDKRFSDDLNPILRHIQSFITNAGGNLEVVDLTSCPMDISMLTAYNTNSSRVQRKQDSSAVLDDMIYGIADKGLEIAPDGVLFRKIYNESIVGPGGYRDLKPSIQHDVQLIKQDNFRA